jgi:hypothetical protein
LFEKAESIGDGRASERPSDSDSQVSDLCLRAFISDARTGTGEHVFEFEGGCHRANESTGENRWQTDLSSR